MLRVVDLEPAELKEYADLRNAAFVRRTGLVAGLGPGEAAMLAMCVGRDRLPATDDTDAIRVARRLMTSLELHRIRSLLRLAIDRGLIDLARARTIHASMREPGFWDKGAL